MRWIGVVLAVAATCTPATGWADVVVIVNKQAKVSQGDLKEIGRLFIGKAGSLGSDDLKPADLPVGDAARDAFYKATAEMDEKALKMHWSRIIFTGKGNRPAIMTDAAAMVKYVKDTPNGIGYVDSTKVTDEVKVIAKITP